MFDSDQAKQAAVLGGFLNLILDSIQKQVEPKAKIISLQTRIDGIEKAKNLETEDDNAA